MKTISRKVPEKEVSKPKIVTKSQDQGEIRSAKLRKPQNGSRIDKNEIHFRKSTAEPEAAKPVTEQFGEREEEKIIDISCEVDCTEIRIITTIADDLAMEHEVNASANNTGEQELFR